METKEERQRLMLGALLLIGVLYGYFGLLLSPIELGITHADRAITERNQQIASNGVELRALREEIARLDRPILDTTANELIATAPESHLATTPSTLSRIFDQHRLPKPDARAAMLLPFAGREDLQRAVWELKLRQADALQAGEVIASLENEFVLGEMREIALETNTATGTVDVTLSLELVIRL
jgi:hypothetical protein